MRRRRGHTRKESLQAWKVSVEQLQANGYHLEVENSHDIEAVAADTDVLLANGQKLLSERQGNWDRVKNELMKALQR